MNVSLTPELEQLVNKKVESGLYNSASEVIREGLRLLAQQDELRQIRFESLRADLNAGLADEAAGNVVSGAEVFEKLKKRTKKA